MSGGLGGLALFAGKYAVLNTATTPPRGGLGKRPEISLRQAQGQGGQRWEVREIKGRENESMRQNNVANLADQSKRLEIKVLRTSILVRHWRSRSDEPGGAVGMRGSEVSSWFLV
jgi:hypothetical protein